VTDNIFDRLRDLLDSAGPVNWRLAREVAESVAGEPEPVEPWVSEEFQELTHAAAGHVSAASPLDATSAVADVAALDGRAWASRSVSGFDYLAEPLAEKMGSSPGAGPLDAVLQPLAPALLGIQMGTMAGFMGQRVLADFDVGLPVAGDGIAYVVPNVESFAAGHGLDRRQTRLFVALHETTRAAQFAVPWVWPHLRDLVSRFVAALRLDPAALEERLGSMDDPEGLQRLMGDPTSLSGLLAGPDSPAALADVQAFMALLEGYAERLIDRVATGLIPETDRIREAIDRRRAEPSQGEQVLQRILGLDLEHHRYREGTVFCDEVARRWGEESLDRIWSQPEALPSLDEIGDPLGWAARVLL
jgi:putative hydrolase